MSDVPAFNLETLLDWLEGRLPEAEARRVAQALENADEQSAATLAWLRAFRQTSASLVLEAPPATTRAMLQGRFAAFAQARQRPGVLQRLVAALSFDSFSQPALAGVRGGDAGGRRQLVFTSTALDVALNIRQRPADQHFELSGQVFLKEEALQESLAVRLLHGESELASASADDLGEFELPGVAAGSYTLLLQAGATEVVVAPLELVA
ncbi:MAG: hypothetical protein MUD01_22835 [Chloroflexaceae bacterium]|jgi:hypothetical protein|nr:hypothetical protein [Chloroflexaceae bacterium]